MLMSGWICGGWFLLVYLRGWLSFVEMYLKVFELKVNFVAKLIAVMRFIKY